MFFMGYICISYGKFLGYQQRNQEYIDFGIQQFQNEQLILDMEKKQKELYQWFLQEQHKQKKIIEKRMKKMT